MAGIFQKPGKADMPLSGSRAGPADGRNWVVSGRSAISSFAEIHVTVQPQREAPAPINRDEIVCVR
jgi:hypothetical protein